MTQGGQGDRIAAVQERLERKERARAARAATGAGAAGEGEGGLAAGEVPAEGGGAPSTRGLMREMLGRDLLFE